MSCKLTCLLVGVALAASAIGPNAAAFAGSFERSGGIERLGSPGHGSLGGGLGKIGDEDLGSIAVSPPPPPIVDLPRAYAPCTNNSKSYWYRDSRGGWQIQTLPGCN